MSLAFEHKVYSHFLCVPNTCAYRKVIRECGYKLAFNELPCEQFPYIHLICGDYARGIHKNADTSELRIITDTDHIREIIPFIQIQSPALFELVKELGYP